MVKIGLKLPVYEFEAELTSRMTLINGLSGKGKTTLVDYLFSPQYEGVREVILSDASYDIVYGNPALKTISSQESKKIFIFDEDINLNDRRLSVIFHNVTDCYFVMITRDPIKTLSYSIEDIYTFMADGKRHWLEKYVDKHVSKWAPGKKGVSVFVIEDSGYGYDWFCRFLNDTAIAVKSAGGKGNVHKLCSNLLERKQDIICFLAIDWCAYGWHINSLIELSDDRLVLNRSYKSFEYMLLNTTLLKGLTDLKEIPDNVLEERYYEELIFRITENTIYEVRHKRNKLSRCFLDDCCPFHPRQVESKGGCDISCRGDKFEMLLKDTAFESLLNYRR